MAKTTPDMVIQLNVSAPGLETVIKALTDAIAQNSANGADIVIPAGSAMQIVGAEVMNAPQEQPSIASAPQETPTQPQAAPNPVSAVQPQTAPAPAPVPAAQPQAITLDAICNAGAKLVEKGQMNQVIALLGKYGVQAVNQIKPEQFAAFAADLRGLGAQI